MKSIIGKTVDTDLTVMNRFEKIVYNVILFWVAMAGAFFGMYTLVFVSEASGLATYDSEDNSADGLSLRHRYAFVRRFLLTKICPTRFYEVGRMNRHLTFNWIWDSLQFHQGLVVPTGACGSIGGEQGER